MSPRLHRVSMMLLACRRTDSVYEEEGLQEATAQRKDVGKLWMETRVSHPGNVAVLQTKTWEICMETKVTHGKGLCCSKENTRGVFCSGAGVRFHP